MLGAILPVIKGIVCMWSGCSVWYYDDRRPTSMKRIGNKLVINAQTLAIRTSWNVIGMIHSQILLTNYLYLHYLLYELIGQSILILRYVKVTCETIYQKVYTKRIFRSCYLYIYKKYWLQIFMNTLCDWLI